jgi:hypothetical protein
MATFYIRATTDSPHLAWKGDFEHIKDAIEFLQIIRLTTNLAIDSCGKIEIFGAGREL